MGMDLPDANTGKIASNDPAPAKPVVQADANADEEAELAAMMMM